MFTLVCLGHPLPSDSFTARTNATVIGVANPAWLLPHFLLGSDGVLCCEKNNLLVLYTRAILVPFRSAAPG